MSRADIVRAYLKAIEDRGDSLSFFTDDAIQEEFPNALVPAGARRTMDDLREANARGRNVMTSETYEVVSLVLADAFLEKYSGDSLGEIQRNYATATDRLQARFTTRRS